MSLTRTVIFILMFTSFLWIEANAQCSSEVHQIPISRGSYQKLQIFVNQGHQPWRLDARLVAIAQFLALEHRKIEGQNSDVPSQTVYEGRSLGVFEFDSASRKGLKYKITVRKFKWLLHSAKKWSWAIWVPAEYEVINCND